MDIYSKFEHQNINIFSFNRRKDKILAPLVQKLLQLNISANTVSFFSGLTALASFFLAFALNIPIIFIIGIWIHLFLDMLDGSVARISKKSTAFGLLMDISADSVGIVATGFYLFYFNIVNMQLVLLFLASYLAVNLLLYIFAKTGREYGFILRPRIEIWIAISIDYIFIYSIMPFIILASSALLIFFGSISLFKLVKCYSK